MAAAEAGVQVFCKKAKPRTVRECWGMVAAWRRHGVKLMVGRKRRLPPWARMVELTADALLGPTLSITVAQYTDNRSAQQDGRVVGFPLHPELEP